MRFGWHIPLPGPFSVGGTIWRSKPRRKRAQTWHGTAPGWRCPHNHRTQEAAQACARRHLAAS